MNGCHFCGQFKDMLKEQEITFMDRDINEHNEEYDLFRGVKNDLVPAFMIVDDVNPTISELFAPDTDFATLEDALQIIKERI
jgi:hypothetical protein